MNCDEANLLLPACRQNFHQTLPKITFMNFDLKDVGKYETDEQDAPTLDTLNYWLQKTSKWVIAKTKEDVEKFIENNSISFVGFFTKKDNSISNFLRCITLESLINIPTRLVISGEIAKNYETSHGYVRVFRDEAIYGKDKWIKADDIDFLGYLFFLIKNKFLN